MLRPSIQSGKTAGKREENQKKKKKKKKEYILEKPTEKIERIHILAGIPQ
jgi:hypothetical protein